MGYLFLINMQQIADCFSASLLASFFFFHGSNGEGDGKPRSDT